MKAAAASRRENYDGVARSLHWLTLLLLLAQFTLAWTMPDVERGTAPVGLIAWHLSFGTAILFTMLARLGWRLSHPAPPAPTHVPLAQQFVSRANHFLLYAILVVLPLLGWANASARGWRVALFGLIPLPHLLPAGSAFGIGLGDIHATTALVLLGLVGLHVAGALYHRLVLRDRVLQRMLPGS